MSEHTSSSTDVHVIKTRVHSLLLERLDFSVMAVGEPESIRSQLSILIMQILEELGVALTVVELQQVVRDIQHDVLGLGPLEVLLEDPTVSDVLVNSYCQIYVVSSISCAESPCTRVFDEDRAYVFISCGTLSCSSLVSTLDSDGDSTTCWGSSLYGALNPSTCTGL